MAKPEITVKLDETNPEPTAIIAASIIKISEGATKLLNGGLNERALLVLIKDHTGVAYHETKKVLDCLPRLKEIYCSKPKLSSKGRSR